MLSNLEIIGWKKISRTAKFCNFYPLVIRRGSPSFSNDSPMRNIRSSPREATSEAVKCKFAQIKKDNVTLCNA